MERGGDCMRRGELHEQSGTAWGKEDYMGEGELRGERGRLHEERGNCMGRGGLHGEKGTAW